MPNFHPVITRFHRCLQGCLLSMAVAVLAPASPISYDEAVAFALDLQTAFAQETHEALIARLDSEGMRRRTFGPLGDQSLHTPQGIEIWQKSIWPVLTQELQALKDFSSMQLNRVMLLQNVRTVECVLVNDRGEFSVVLLWLGRAEEGKVKIQDVHFIANQLEMSRRLRQTFLMLGLPMSADLDEEDRDVAFIAGPYSMEIRAMFRALQEKDFAQAFRFWNMMPDRLKAKSLWSDIRDTLAAAGCEAAQTQQREQYFSGQLTNKFSRFVFAQKFGTVEEAAGELEDLIQRASGQPFLRVVRSELLNQAGQHEAALAQARDVLEHYPYMNSAYLAALQAALAGGRPSLLPEILERWALLIKPEEMDRQLETIPGLKRIAAAPEFISWRQAVPATPVD